MEGINCRRDLTKNIMLQYIADYGSAEDKAWFKDAVARNTVDRSSKLVGDFKDVQISTLRDEFIARFPEDFKNLTSKADPKSFFDEVNKL